MECRKPLFFRRHHRLLAFDAADDAVDRGDEIVIAHGTLVFARSGQGRLVADVGDVRAGEAGRVLGDVLQVEVVAEFDLAKMDLENVLALVQVGQGHLDLAVEASRAHERLVEDVGPVGRSEHDDAAVGAEAVHLRQELVERVLTLVVGGEAYVLAAGTSDGVDLVDEDDARCLLLGLVEKVAHAAGADADEHLHEIGSGDGEEGDVGLPRDRLRQQGLAGAGRADEEGAFRDLAAEGRILRGILEEVDDLHHFLLSPIQAGHVLEGDVDLILVGELAGGLAHIEGVYAPALASAAHVAAHSAEHPAPQDDEEEQWQDPLQHLAPDLGVILHDHLDLGIGRQFGIERSELLLRVELVGNQEEEMG